MLTVQVLEELAGAVEKIDEALKDDKPVKVRVPEQEVMDYYQSQLLLSLMAYLAGTDHLTYDIDESVAAYLGELGVDLQNIKREQ